MNKKAKSMEQTLMQPRLRLIHWQQPTELKQRLHRSLGGFQVFGLLPIFKRGQIYFRN